MPRQSAITTCPPSPLKIAIVKSGIPQGTIARRLRMTEQRLSRIVQGHLKPTSDEQDRLSELLGLPIRTLFRASAA